MSDVRFLHFERANGLNGDSKSWFGVQAEEWMLRRHAGCTREGRVYA